MLRTDISKIFKDRRDELMRRSPGSAYLFLAPPEFIKNDDNTFPFRQESSFFYLSGLSEPQSAMMLVPKTGAPGDYKMVLFVQDRNPEQELWTGELYGVDRAQKIFSPDECYSIREFEGQFAQLLKSADRLYYRLGMHEVQDRKILELLERSRKILGRTGRGILQVLDPREIVGEMRLIKQPEEIAHIRKVCAMTGRAHKATMAYVKPGMNEKEVQGYIEYQFKKEGCTEMGYGSIVASGKNACCLHYHANNAVLEDNQLLLIDAGGELDYYGADITRTFPVGRKFTPAQEKIYDVVLSCQKQTISFCKPGIAYEEIHKFARMRLIDGLLSLGILKGSAESCFKDQTDKRFYPHGTGHFLGLDVHDAGLYYQGSESTGRKSRVLEPGMLFTIEPGLYFQVNDSGYPSEYKGIGIRIEDDVLVTPQGLDVLTSEAPKEKSDILSLR